MGDLKDFFFIQHYVGTTFHWNDNKSYDGGSSMYILTLPFVFPLVKYQIDQSCLYYYV